MAKSLNEVNLIGTLGRDAETKFTPSGAAVTNFSIATEYSFKKGNDYVSDTSWHNIVLWQAEKLAAYLLKGTKVYVKGRLQYRTYEDKDGVKKTVTDIVADSHSIVLLSSKQGGQGSSSGGDHYNRTSESQQSPGYDSPDDSMGDDAPF